jgi:hypothetical protein
MHSSHLIVVTGPFQLLLVVEYGVAGQSVPFLVEFHSAVGNICIILPLAVRPAMYCGNLTEYEDIKMHYNDSNLFSRQIIKLTVFSHQISRQDLLCFPSSVVAEYDQLN